MERREFLQAVGATAAFGTAGLRHLSDAHLLEQLEGVTIDLATRSRSTPPALLLGQARGHLGTLSRGLAAGQSPRMFALVADAAILVGRLAQRLDDYGEAHRALSWADALAAEAGNTALQAHARGALSGLVSGIPRGGQGGHPRRALDLLDSALTAAPDAPAGIRAWLLARRAEEHAMAGEGVAAHHDLDAAATTLAAAQPNTPFFHHLSDAWLNGYVGNVARLLGETKYAIRVLERSAAEAGDGRPADRSGVLADLAAAYALDGDHAAAGDILTTSLLLARQSGAPVAEGRVRGIRRRYFADIDAPAVRRLDDLLSVGGS